MYGENPDAAVGQGIENPDNWASSCNVIEENIKFLGETRERGNVTREVLLNDIQERLKHTYCIEFLETQKDELVRILLLDLESGSEEELIYSCGIIRILFAHFSGAWKSIYIQFEPILKKKYCQFNF